LTISFYLVFDFYFKIPLITQLHIQQFLVFLLEIEKLDESLENERLERESRDFKGRARVSFARGIYGTLDSAVNFGPAKDVPHLSSWTARMRATCNRRISRTAPRHRTPGGSLGSRTKGTSRIHGLWTWSGECSQHWQLDQSITKSKLIKISRLSKSKNQDNAS